MRPLDGCDGEDGLTPPEPDFGADELLLDEDFGAEADGEDDGRELGALDGAPPADEPPPDDEPPMPKARVDMNRNRASTKLTRMSNRLMSDLR
jgi:hypothetical protein